MEKDLDKILYNTCAIIFLFSFMSLLKQLGVYIVCYIYITYIYIYIYISNLSISTVVEPSNYSKIYPSVHNP